MKSVFILIFACFSFAQAQEIVTQVTTTVTPPVSKTVDQWIVEAQVNTQSNSRETTFGPTLFYILKEKELIGLRYLAPLNSSSDSATSLLAVYRHIFAERKTSFFAEGTIGYHHYSINNPSGFIDRTLLSSSLGGNMGVVRRLDDGMAYGGIAGFDITSVGVEKGHAYKKAGATFVYPRLTLFTNLSF
jgi:hypothetical protein